jgi:cytochrome c553
MNRAIGIISLLALSISAHAVCAQSALPPRGAASCSGCHNEKGANPSVPSLRSYTASAIAESMRHYKTDAQPKSTIMPRIARGFNDAEIDAIAQYWGKPK